MLDDEDLLGELERERRRDEQACQCGHARRQHVISRGAGLDLCAATLPGRQVCPCTLFHLVRGHQLDAAERQTRGCRMVLSTQGSHRASRAAPGRRLSALGRPA